METLLHVGLSNAVVATLLALFAALVGRWTRRPALAHGLWLLVLLKLVTPPLVPVPVPWLTPAPAAAEESRRAVTLQPVRALEESPFIAGPPIVDTEEAAPAMRFDRPAAEISLEPELTQPAGANRQEMPWAVLVAGFWLAGSLLWFLLAGARLWRFGRLVSQARRAPTELQERAAELAKALGLARCPEVCLVAGPVSPLLWALGARACILLPAGLWQRLTLAQRDTLLTHELAHLRRRDHWVRRLELVALGLYWWHPVAWWARRELQEAEEQCCDAWVVRALPAAAQAYAEALVAAAVYLSRPPSPLPLGASGIGQVQHLKRRLTMILCETTPRARSRAAFWVLLVLGALLLPWLPTLAEQPTQDQPPENQATDKPPVGTNTAVDRVPDPQPQPPKGTATGNGDTPPSGGTILLGGLRSLGVNSNGGLTGSTAQNKGPGDGPPSQRVQDAKDEVELLEAQLQVRRAQLRASQAGIGQNKQRLTDLVNQYKQGVLPQSEVFKVQQEVTAAEAQVGVKEAEVLEAEVRLKQARRRLDALQPSPPPAAKNDPLDRSSRARMQNSLPDGDASVDFGTVDRATAGRLVHSFRLTNRTGQPAHILGINVSGSWLSARVGKNDLAVDEQTQVDVTADTSRLAGAKIGRIHVTFDKPWMDQLTFEIRVDVRTDYQATNPKRPPLEEPGQERLQNVEKKLDDLLKEVEALRKELKTQPASPRQNRNLGADRATPTDMIAVMSRKFKLPFQVEAGRMQEIQQLILMVSTDRGETYKTQGVAKPEDKGFEVVVPEDGLYYFAVFTVDKTGKKMPEFPAPQKIMVDTTSNGAARP